MYNGFHKFKSQKTQFFTPNNLVLKLTIQLTTQLFNLTIKYLKLLKLICICCACLLTFQKAFERLDHMMLLKKFESYGIRGNNHNWTKSSLSNKKQCIETNPTAKISLEQVNLEFLITSYFFYISIASKMLRLHLLIETSDNMFIIISFCSRL